MDAYRILLPEEGEHKYFFTDNELFWGAAFRKNPDGETYTIVGDAFEVGLPMKADDLGYRQAHVEMLLSLVSGHFPPPKVVDYLDISGNEVVELFRMNSCIKYRVLVSTKIPDVRRIAAWHFIAGYKRAMSEIMGRMSADGHDEREMQNTRSTVADEIKDAIRKYQPDGLFDEYMELYGEVTWR